MRLYIYALLENKKFTDFTLFANIGYVQNNIVIVWDMLYITSNTALDILNTVQNNS